MPDEVRDRRWAVLAVLSVGMFVVMLDATVVNVAMASIMERFSAGVSSVQWVINAYVLVFACSLIVFGRVGDVVGRTRVFLLGLGLFTAASLACAFAPSIGWLIGFRGLQGVGGAMMLPSTLSLATVVFPPEQRGTAIGVWAGVNGLATAVGPTVGGLIIDRLGWPGLFDGASWPWVFLINVPIGVVLLIVGARIMPESRDRSAGRHIDLRGAAVLTVALLALTFGLIEGEARGWDSPAILACFAVATLGLTVFVLVERRQPQPLIPLGMFRSRTFSAANATGLIMSFGLAGGMFLLPLFFQLVFGYSALKTGLLLTPLSGGLFLGAPLAGRVTDRVGPRWPACAGMITAAAGFTWLQATMSPGAAWQALVLPLLVCGFGIGAVVAPVASAVMGASARGVVGAASGIYSTVRQFGGLLAVAVMGAVLQGRAAAAIRDETLRRLGEVPGLPGSLRERLAEALGGSGTSLGADAELPPDLLAELSRLPAETMAAVDRAIDPGLLSSGLVDAMQVTMLASAVVLVAGAAVALLIGRPEPDGATATASGSVSPAAEPSRSTTPQAVADLEPWKAADIRPRAATDAGPPAPEQPAGCATQAVQSAVPTARIRPSAR